MINFDRSKRAQIFVQFLKYIQSIFEKYQPILNLIRFSFVIQFKSKKIFSDKIFHNPNRTNIWRH